MNMMLCSDTVTLIRPIRGQKDDTYACFVLVGCSWYSKAVVRLEDKGIRAANTVRIRIPSKLVLGETIPKTGDYMVHGAVDGIHNLKELYGMEYVKLLSVGNNCRGQFPHWAVIGG